MNTQVFYFEEKKVTVYLPNHGDITAPVWLCFPDNDAEAEILAEKLAQSHVVMAVSESDWENAFTPWAAPRLFKKGRDFGGGADDYYAFITQRLLPEIEQKLGLTPAWRGVLGYSLAGLWAIYGAYKHPYFQRIGCVSGSLWFDNWLAFVAEHRPSRLPQAVYFSVGADEAHAKNPRLAQVADHMQQTWQIWQQYDVACVFETHSGGHFDDVPMRLLQAATWLQQSV